VQLAASLPTAAPGPREDPRTAHGPRPALGWFCCHWPGILTRVPYLQGLPREIEIAIHRFALPLAPLQRRDKGHQHDSNSTPEGEQYFLAIPTSRCPAGSRVTVRDAARSYV